jgi:hypothetical protein
MELPKAFIGEIRVLKKITDDTMTTTRLTEFATEWVTGDILANKLYETCIRNNHKHCYIKLKTLKIKLMLYIKWEKQRSSRS